MKRKGIISTFLGKDLYDIKAEDVAVIKLKGARVFRKEFWNVESLLDGVEFDVYLGSNDDSNTQ